MRTGDPLDVRGLRIPVMVGRNARAASPAPRHRPRGSRGPIRQALLTGFGHVDIGAGRGRLMDSAYAGIYPAERSSPTSMADSTESTIADETLVAEVRGAAQGDTRAFEELVRRHQRQVLANCRHMTRASNDAEDLAQEVFVKAFFAIAQFEGRSTFKTWLTHIKVNHCLNYLRRQRGISYVELEDRDERASSLRDAPTALRELERRDQRARITAALDGLSDALRVPLVLREVDGLQYDEIARTLGIGLSAVKMRVKRGREQFRHLLVELEARPESAA
jgi:RNA polymerase sigma-70 factor (ECF subfamily)